MYIYFFFTFPFHLATEFHPNANGGRHKVLSNGSLHLMDVHMDDGGEYECIASNGIGDGIRKSVSVLIHGKYK